MLQEIAEKLGPRLISRSLSAELNTPETRNLGQGRKVSPYVNNDAETAFTLVETDEPGAIQHIRMTPTGNRRMSIIRFYWDGERSPSLNVPWVIFLQMAGSLILI